MWKTIRRIRLQNRWKVHTCYQSLDQRSFYSVLRVKASSKSICKIIFSLFGIRTIVTEKTLEAAIELCKQFDGGFAYWTFGIFTYVIYSADLFEVRLLAFKYFDIESYIFHLSDRKSLPIQNTLKKVLHINLYRRFWEKDFWQVKVKSGLPDENS